MIKLENNKGEVTIEMNGSLLELTGEFMQLFVKTILKLSEEHENRGQYLEGHGAVHLMTDLISMFVMQQAGRMSFMDFLALDKSEVHKFECKIKSDLRNAIEEFKATENDENTRNKNAKEFLEKLLGVNLPDIDVEAVSFGNASQEAGEPDGEKEA